MTRMLEDAVLFIAKIQDWDVSHVVYCKDFNKNCCHMRRNLPSFSKEAMQLELIVPLNDFVESPIIDSAKQMTPLTYEPSISPLRFSPPHQLIRSTNTLISAIDTVQTPVQTSVQTLVQTPVQSPVKSTVKSPVKLTVKSPVKLTVKSPEVEFLGVRQPSPDVEYLGTQIYKVPSPVKSMPTFKRTGGTHKKNKMKKKKSNKNKMKRYVL
jgi:hypothetical protein